MQINTSNIYNNYIDYSYLTKEFDSIFINYYRNMVQLSDYWKSPKADRFFDRIEKEQKEAQVMFEELLIINDVYKKIFEMYSKIGNKILIDHDNIEKVFLKFEQLDGIYNSILKKYDEIMLKANAYYYNLMIAQKEVISNSKQKIDQIYSNIENVIREIDEFENDIKSKLSKVKLQSIKENDISEF